MKKKSLFIIIPILIVVIIILFLLLYNLKLYLPGKGIYVDDIISADKTTLDTAKCELYCSTHNLNSWEDPSIEVEVGKTCAELTGKTSFEKDCAESS